MEWVKELKFQNLYIKSRSFPLHSFHPNQKQHKYLTMQKLSRTTVNYKGTDRSKLELHFSPAVKTGNPKSKLTGIVFGLTCFSVKNEQGKKPNLQSQMQIKRYPMQ